MLSPSVATTRPSAIAAVAICWMRCRWLAKLAVMIRLPFCWANSVRRTVPTLVSLGAYPASSAFVESLINSRIPGSFAIWPMRARSVRRWSTGCEVDLEVAGVQDHALRGVHGDRVGVGHRVGDRDELDVERADRDRLAVADRLHVGLLRETGLVDAVAGQAERQPRSVDRQRAVAQVADAVAVAQEVLDRPDVVLVSVGEHQRRRSGRRSHAGT